MAKTKKTAKKKKAAIDKTDGDQPTTRVSDTTADRTPLHPSELVKPGATDEGDDSDAFGRPTAREGLKPVGREKPHPTAAARVGKTSGQIMGTANTIALEPPARDKGDRTITVEATKLGYIDDVRRRLGDVFEIRESQFSERWMRPVDGRTPRRVTSSAEALKREQDALKQLKTPQAGMHTDPDTIGDAKPTGSHNPLGER